MTMDLKSGFDDYSPEELADPATFSLDDLATKGGVFVIPVDAPIPSELKDAKIPVGTLYDRLASLASEDQPGFSFVPISGAELLQIERAWRLLQVAKRVYVLFDMPGARYDVMFTQATRQIGLRRIEWPNVAETLMASAIEKQRTADKTPWALSEDLSKPARRLPARAEIGVDPLEPPNEDS